MAFNVSSNFEGKAAGFYISAALKEAKSLDYLTMIENVKFISNIQRMSHGTDGSGNGLVRNATCDFTNAGKLELTEKKLQPKNLQVNLDLCKKTLLSSWEALQMRAGAGAPPPASFEDYVISYMGEIIASHTENSIWNGAATNNGEFEGFLTSTTGIFAVDGTVLTESLTTPFDKSNIVANIQKGIDKVAASASAVLTKEDLHIYLSPKSYHFYVQAISDSGFNNMYSMQGDYQPIFEGIKVAVCPGMANDEFVIAEKSNLFFGTDLLSDATRIQILDMGALDGSDNMRLVARYSAGVQLGVGADIVNAS
jgi:hypothetical protein